MVIAGHTTMTIVFEDDLKDNPSSGLAFLYSTVILGGWCISLISLLH